ncbi:topoisomerase [Pseudoxanthomonas suwonensis]|uniref:glucuronyl esterase domain-containing protein n=1 Tax=Pseudoxanthomonas suwonensis TaxID=314722 RepID=UPI000A96F354|nr:topoisomerase [Pseudoxanthomonas suwonensis]
MVVESGARRRYPALLCLLAMACGAAPHATMAAGGDGLEDARAPYASAHENEGMDCATSPPATAVQANLPDPFAGPDGTRIAAREQWRCQRQQTLRTLEDQVYGRKGTAPDSVTGNVYPDRIDVTVDYRGRRETFSAVLHLPDGPGPHPAIVVVGGIGGIDPRLLASEGVARIDYLPTAIGAETGSGRARRGAFFDLYGDEVRSTGTLMAWAWGISRLLDVIAQSDQRLLRADAVAVAGCSRFGKGALAAGAFDQRVALTMPIESGSGGVPVWRGVAGTGAQPPHSAYGEQPWLGDAFGAFAEAVDTLATDQHQVVGLVAPRGLLVLDNPHIDWLGARAGHLGALAGAEIYRALGAAGNLGYHSAVADPKHCAWRGEWDAPARDAIRRHLRQAGADDLSIIASDTDSVRLEDHRDWDTPPLR